MNDKQINDITDVEIDNYKKNKRTEIRNKYLDDIKLIEDAILKNKQEIFIRQKRKSIKAQKEIDAYIEENEKLKQRLSNIHDIKMDEITELNKNDKIFIESEKRMKIKREAYDKKFEEIEARIKLEAKNNMHNKIMSNGGYDITITEQLQHIKELKNKLAHSKKENTIFNLKQSLSRANDILEQIKSLQKEYAIKL